MKRGDIDQTYRGWQQSGLRLPSVINASNLATVRQADIRHLIDSLSTTTMQLIDDCIRVALQL